MARALAPGGVAVVQVPRLKGVPTEEDPEAPVDERLRRFGQRDHVRYYGDDFEDRLRAAGLAVCTMTMKELYRPIEADLLEFSLMSNWAVHDRFDGGPRADGRALRGLVEGCCGNGARQSDSRACRC